LCQSFAKSSQILLVMSDRTEDVAADDWVGVADMVFMIVPPVCCCPENRKK
jgi:hypothetical protein